MALVPYSVTALAESDAEGTSGKNIIAGAIVEFYNAQTGGSAQTLYDDAVSTNPSTTKATDAQGQVTVFVEQGLWWITINGGTRRAVTIDNGDSVASAINGLPISPSSLSTGDASFVGTQFEAVCAFDGTIFSRNFNAALGAAAHYVQIGALNGTTPTASARLSTVADFSGAGTGNITLDVLNAGTMETAVTVGSTKTVRFNSYGAGTLTTDASGNITASSDSSLKENIVDYNCGLDCVNQLRPVTYNWTKESGLDQDNVYAGFIAQEVEESGLMHAVYGGDGRKTLTDRAIIAALVNSVKELTLRLENIETE